jgi:hypothetical protein
MGAKKDQEIDHKNRNRLDNRLDNLRFATSRQNSQNTANYAGDMKYIQKQSPTSWYIRIRAIINGTKQIVYSETFEDLYETLKARDAAELELTQRGILSPLK